ncbi:hypothetical protein J4H86_04430 [Spiractinospora alimapuensis]|uniref:hypothetical protein n=1 Tax=Spiractinospora alimapuensis TaxID=2820884 RepID=UPI001F31F17F|nr:hypothetical protein [Spiractinospora alimapuensis]QVQ53057.1 hypothetical protein J4H86_04430 [Spiractinospora alimapuensis]
MRRTYSPPCDASTPTGPPRAGPATEFFATGGVVTAHDPHDGFTYTVEDRESGDAVVVRISSPCYRDPHPRSVFTGIYPE